MISPLNREAILAWLLEEDPRRLRQLWDMADQVRRQHVGDEVHLRGLIEVSSHCVCQCGYCGLRAANKKLTRYRLSADEILSCALQARELGYGTVVLQAGEDPGLHAEWVADVVRNIKHRAGLAVTLSLGERKDEELRLWRQAGADRYLLRFETSDPTLYAAIHPAARGGWPNRIALLRRLQKLGYETGSGIMVGLPGQTFESVATDITLFRDLDLDMIGIGPFIPHPDTPLGQLASDHHLAEAGQVPGSELMVCKAVALTRLVRPDANIPSTTALATINKAHGRELGLRRGANVVMPNLTPLQYRQLYQIYPAKACISEAAHEFHATLGVGIAALGRRVGIGPGGRRRSLRLPLAA